MKIFLTPRCPPREYFWHHKGKGGEGQALPVGWFLCAPWWAKMVQTTALGSTSWVKGEGALQASVLLIQMLQVDLYKEAAWLVTL